jgi:hypothetical protein
MTGLIIFTLFCLVLIIYLSVRHNRLLNHHIEEIKNRECSIKIQREVLYKYSTFITEKDLVDDYIDFVEGREWV